MKAVKWTTLILIACTSWGVATGCSDDDDNTPSAGGTSGKGGKGGTSGKGGTGGTGTGGTGGTAGTGGITTGGVGGTGGSAGNPDASAGTGGGTSDAGDAGDGGPTVKMCIDQCNNDNDCRLPGFGDAGPMPSGLICNQATKLCEPEVPAPKCSKASDCYGTFWGPPQACTSQEQCEGGACVIISGSGVCAPVKGDGGCDFPNTVVTMPKFGADGGTVEVCGNADGLCDANGACYQRECSAEQSCPAEIPGKAFCDTATDKCGCTSDLGCSTDFTGHKCNTTTHTCGCASDDDCTGIPNADKCYNGVCGCSGNSACSPLFTGTTSTCK